MYRRQSIELRSQFPDLPFASRQVLYVVPKPRQVRAYFVGQRELPGLPRVLTSLQQNLDELVAVASAAGLGAVRAQAEDGKKLCY